MMQATLTILFMLFCWILAINDENMIFSGSQSHPLHRKFIGASFFHIVTCFLLHGWIMLNPWLNHEGPIISRKKKTMKVMTRTTWQDLVQLPTNPWGCRAKSCVANRLAIPRLFAPRSVLKKHFVGWKKCFQHGNPAIWCFFSKGKKLFGSRRLNWRTMRTRWEIFQRGGACYRFERPIIAGIPNASNVTTSKSGQLKSLKLTVKAPEKKAIPKGT